MVVVDPQSPTAEAVDTDAETCAAQATPPALASDAGSDAPSAPVVDARCRPLRGEAFEDRYRVGVKLGEGGMGKVFRCTDLRIGRDVAVKVIRSGNDSSADTRARFEREARIQGQLEHPAIVPVYDLAEREDGTVYFAMKRIQGQTLEEIIAQQRNGDAECRRSCTRRRLLTAFSNVCLAIAFAHSRGVVHRDLKPANIILGEFGEVYALDWGIAKVVGMDDLGGTDEGRLDARQADSQPTAAGTVLGTPGYMAPEQLRGEHDRVDARADIYALGAILFELLALEPLHPRDNPQRLVSSTLVGADARPSRVADEPVPPELDEICVRATALDPDDRFSSTREMHEALEHFLDGDRDVTRRREMAKERLAAAQQALAGAAKDPSQAVAARAQVMRELNSALTLDPGNHDALAWMVRALTDQTGSLPAEAEEELVDTRMAAQRRGARIGALAFLSCFALDPLLMIMGVRSHLAMAPLGIFVLAAAIFGYYLATRRRVSLSAFIVMTVLVGGLAASTSVLFGPFVLAPGMVVAAALPLMVNVRADRVRRMALMATAVLAVMVPAILQWLDVLPRSYTFDGETIAILPWAVNFSAPSIIVFLAAASSALALVPIIVLGRSVDALVSAERRLFAQAWLLRQVIPERARGAAQASLATQPKDECETCAVSEAVHNRMGC